MLAQVVVCRDPIRPANNRTVTLMRRRRSLSNLAPKTSAQLICNVNGKWISRKAWNRRVRHGDSVVFVVLPQGGGGSNPLKLILMLALSMFAPQIGAWANLQLLSAESSMAFALENATLGRIIGGGLSILANALIPAPKPPTSQMSSALSSPSPTYTLNAQGNQARLGSPIPVIYGRHEIYPDFGAQPYTEFAGNEQYVYQLFCIGQGEYDIESINIEDTPISSFDEINYEIVTPGGSVTLFPTAVEQSAEVAGQELNCVEGDYSQSGTTITINLPSHGLAAGADVYFNPTSGTATSGVLAITTVVDSDNFTLTAAASLTDTGNCLISDIIGPYVANTAGTTANHIGIDLLMSRGMYYANDSGGLSDVTIRWRSEAQQIDDAGSPVGDWFLLGETGKTDSTTTPQRVSEKFSVTDARYRVRAWRVDEKKTSSRYGHEISWAGLRAYRPGIQTYGNVTMVAMRLRATNNLSQQASRKINFIVTRKLQTWNPVTGWSSSLVPTRSVAWAIADICRADYGAKLQDSRIDLQALYDLDAVLTAKGHSFDMVFDSPGTVMEALTIAARVGRAMPYIQGGVVHVVRDQAETIPVAMFSQRNIIKNSFRLDYAMPTEDTTDCVDVTYFDADVWSWRTVRSTPSGSSGTNPAAVTLPGVTVRAHAWQEGMYMAECNRSRRRFVTFGTEMEGFIPTLADLIAIQHDMPKWGQSGDIVDFSSGRNLLKYSQKFDNAAWSKLGMSVTPDAAIAPDGTMTAELITNTGGAVSLIYCSTPVDPSATTDYYASIYVKKGNKSVITLNVFYVGNTENDVYFNLDTMAVTGLPYAGQYIFEVLSGGWFRIGYRISRDASGSRAEIRLRLWIHRGASTIGDTAYTCGAQINPGSTVQPYIPTEATSKSAGYATLSEPLDWSAGGDHVLAFRRTNGQPAGPYAVTAGTDVRSVVLTDWDDATDPTPYTGSDMERSHYAFGPTNLNYIRARVLAVRPKSAETVEIYSVVEADAVHTADTGTSPDAVTWLLPSRNTTPLVLGLHVTSMTDDVGVMMLSWQPGPGADHYLIEQSNGSGTWIRCGETSSSSYTVRAIYGSSTIVRVAAVGITRGPWISINYAGVADYMWVEGDDADSMWVTGDDTEIMWS